MESELEQTLIAQKRSIALVAGSVPRLAVGCVASFPPQGRTLEIDAFDPDEDEIETVHLDVDLDRYFLAYYEPFIAAIDFGEVEESEDGNSEMIFAALPQAGLRIGILRTIADRVRAASQGDMGLAESLRSLLEQKASSAKFPDGTTVETNWDGPLSLNDWES